MFYNISEGLLIRPIRKLSVIFVLSDIRKLKAVKFSVMQYFSFSDPTRISKDCLANI